MTNRLYKCPMIYKYGLQLVLGKNYIKRNKYMVDEIGTSNVLEVGCGIGLFSENINNEQYQGFDINTRFIKHAQKQGINAYVGNALNPDSYNKTDIILLCDIIHHLPPSQRKKIINNCFQNCKNKLIICEPLEKDTSNNYLSVIRKKIIHKIDDTELGWELYHDEFINEIKNGFGIIPDNILINLNFIGNNVIATFHKNIKKPKYKSI